MGAPRGSLFWKDKYNLRGNNALAQKIKAELERTAILIAILSSGYLASGWCLDEARFFTQHFAGDLAGRVFVVEKAKLDDTAVVPQQLTGLRNYRFWYIDDNKQPRTFATPVPRPEEIQYFRQVQDLARDTFQTTQTYNRAILY